MVVVSRGGRAHRGGWGRRYFEEEEPKAKAEKEKNNEMNIAAFAEGMGKIVELL